MANNDWNNLGRDIKDIVQDALDTGNFNRLNRDLGATLVMRWASGQQRERRGKKRHGPGKKQYEPGFVLRRAGQDPKTKQRGRLPQDLHRQLFVE